MDIKLLSYERHLVQSARFVYWWFDEPVTVEMLYMKPIMEVCLGGPRSIHDPYVPVHQEVSTAKFLHDENMKNLWNTIDNQMDSFFADFKGLNSKPVDQTMYNQLRAFAADKRIVFVMPKAPDVPKGYYDGCKSFDHEMDNILFHPTIETYHTVDGADGKRFLTMHRGKHKRQTSEGQKQFILTTPRPWVETVSDYLADINAIDQPMHEVKELPKPADKE